MTGSGGIWGPTLVAPSFAGRPAIFAERSPASRDKEEVRPYEREWLV